jgi:hypothetical protein
MDMMLKQNYSHCNGRVLICHAPIKQDKDAQKSNVDSSFFITKELFIMSSLQQSRWLIKLSG